MNAPVRRALTESVNLCLIDDVSQVVQRAPFIARYPAELWTVGLVSELAQASAEIAAKVAELQEATGAGR